MKDVESHYAWLEDHIVDFAATFNIENMNRGVIAAHGDKCYGYRSYWKENEVPFALGVAIYFLTYFHPFSETARDTKDGWVKPEQWVVNFFNSNKNKLKKYLEDF